MAFKSYYKLVKYNNPNKVPFYFEDVSGLGSELRFGIYGTGDPVVSNIEVSNDLQTWTNLGTVGSGTSQVYVTVPANGRVYVRSEAYRFAQSSTEYYGTRFRQKNGGSVHNLKVGGNIMSLMYGSNFTGTETSFPNPSLQYIFQEFFRDLGTWLTDASDLILPVTTMSGQCYKRMFRDCTSLIAAPALPATTLANNCYLEMFRGCTALTTAPIISAVTLAESSCYFMFYDCTSLIAAPALPATTLAESCYGFMFYGCTSLSSVTCLATNISAYNCTYLWLNGVSANGTFTKSPNMSSWTTGVDGIPSGWTVQDAQ